MVQQAEHRRLVPRPPGSSADLAVHGPEALLPQHALQLVPSSSAGPPAALHKRAPSGSLRHPCARLGDIHMAQGHGGLDREPLAKDRAHPGPPAGWSVPKGLVGDTAVAFPEWPRECAAPS